MTEPKQPADHLEKAERPRIEKTESGRRVTLTGVTVTVPDDALDDFELLDDMRAVDVDRNASRLPALLRRLIGEDFRTVMDALRDPGTGRVPIERAAGWLRDLIQALDPNS